MRVTGWSEPAILLPTRRRTSIAPPTLERGMGRQPPSGLRVLLSLGERAASRYPVVDLCGSWYHHQFSLCNSGGNSSRQVGFVTVTDGAGSIEHCQWVKILPSIAPTNWHIWILCANLLPFFRRFFYLVCVSSVLIVSSVWCHPAIPHFYCSTGLMQPEVAIVR